LFKIGDKVRLIEYDTNETGIPTEDISILMEQTLTVDDIYEEDEEIKTVFVEENSWNYSPEWLELIEE
jgi:hypothetical protein